MVGLLINVIFDALLEKYFVQGTKDFDASTKYSSWKVDISVFTFNRVTCRDWFQLSLKECLTVFWDQEFSSDMGSRTVKRIADVSRLRISQFPQDAGPMAHPVRPHSYIKMDNFYTVSSLQSGKLTGAEVVRMYKTLLGASGFMKALFSKIAGRLVPVHGALFQMDPVHFLYKGTLRVLLVLLHDFPEFLCDYHFSFSVYKIFLESNHLASNSILTYAFWNRIGIIIREIESNIAKRIFLANLRMKPLPDLCKKFEELVEILVNSDLSKKDSVVLLLQDILELDTPDMMVNEIRDLGELSQGSKDSGNQLFATIAYPSPNTAQWEEQIRRLHLLLTVKESATDVPTNLEARRRMTFFSNSLFMNMPRAPLVLKMLSFSEETTYSKSDLERENEDDEWNNFMECINCKGSEILENDENVLQLRHWASLRGQTLSKIVRGMMYYRRSLKLQTFLDMASEDEILEGYKSIIEPSEEDRKSQRSTYTQLEDVADMKFTYVATCQIYGNQKHSGDMRATNILNLMVNNPALREAYIDDVEGRNGGKNEKVYYSVLVKAIDNLDQEIFRIKLPGTAKIGEGKPKNQNNAIIFTRGEALQTIDMNQDNYLEEAFKMCNLLEEFNEDHGVRQPTILGVREHIFTGRVSSLAWFMLNKETSFVTIGQRVLARPLKIVAGWIFPGYTFFSSCVFSLILNSKLLLEDIAGSHGQSLSMQIIRCFHLLNLWNLLKLLRSLGLSALVHKHFEGSGWCTRA
ncbi:hypothetical protein ACS0TY_000717 [Phlomoides rotata]